jgi:hypothetical protein
MDNLFAGSRPGGRVTGFTQGSAQRARKKHGAGGFGLAHSLRGMRWSIFRQGCRDQYWQFHYRPESLPRLFLLFKTGGQV